VELLSLLANNVLLVLPSRYLAFRDRATSARSEIEAALGRMKARGVREFTVGEMLEEVQLAGSEISRGSVRRALWREVEHEVDRLVRLPVERSGYGKYRIV